MTALENETATTTEVATKWTAQVTVRVPRGSEQTLATAAARRVQTVAQVENVEVESVCGLEPALAATVVDIVVVVEMDRERAKETVTSALETAPGAQRVATTTSVESEADSQQTAPPD